MGELQFRHGTAAAAASANPVLDVAEPGYATDTKEFKIGDGSTPWEALNPLIALAPGRRVNIANKGSATGSATYATSAAGTSEVYYEIGIDATDISFVYNHWYTQNISGVITEVIPAGSITFSMSVRVVSTTNPGTVVSTTPWVVTFNGRTTVTVDPGGSVESQMVGLSLKAGDIIAVRTFLSSGTAYPYRTSFAFTGILDGFTATSDLTASTTAIAPSTGNFYCPAAIMGYVDRSSRGKSVIGFGNSIGAATGDVGSGFSVPALYPGGYLIRALNGKAGLINASVGGDLLTWFQGTNGSRYRLTQAARADAAIIEYGTNDFTGGLSAATVQAALLDLATKLRRTGLNPVFVQTITPRTTSTDNWATVANQTPITGNDQRILHNTWLRDGCPIDPTTKAAVTAGTVVALRVGQYLHPITGVFDVASAVESSLNSGLWLPANRVATGSMTSGSSTLATSSTTFSSAIQENGGDIGGNFFLAGAGAAGAVLTGYIDIWGSSTSVTVSVNAGTTVTNAVLVIGAMTVDGVHPSPHGHYLMSQDIDVSKLAA